MFELFMNFISLQSTFICVAFGFIVAALFACLFFFPLFTFLYAQFCMDGLMCKGVTTYVCMFMWGLKVNVRNYTGSFYLI